MAASADRVWAVVEFHNCEDGYDYQGTLVVALYGSKQTAQQHADRDRLHVIGMDVESRLRSY